MKRRFLSVTVVAALLLAGCGNDEKIDNGQPQPVRFSTAIHKAEGVQTKAAGSAWAADDAIGVFMVKKGTTDIAKNAENKKYITLQGDGNFTADAGDEIYYPMDGSAVDFMAYYPYAGTTTLNQPIEVKIEATQTADNQPAFDLLYAQADNGGSGFTKTSNPTVPLEFKHQLAKLVMNTVADPSVNAADLNGMSVAIEGMHTQSTFDLSTGILGTAGGVEAIIPRTVTDGEQYDAIILPGSYSAGEVKVVFMVNGEPFTWTVDATDFTGGKEYDYEVKLTRTGVEVTGTITDWEVEKRVEVTAN